MSTKSTLSPESKAVLKDSQPVGPPGPGKIDAAGRHAVFTRQGAASKEKSLFLAEAVGRSGKKTDIARIPKRADLAPVKNSLSAPENEIDGSFDPAVLKPLMQDLCLPQFIRQEAGKPINEIRRQRAEKQRILCGTENAVFH